MMDIFLLSLIAYLAFVIYGVKKYTPARRDRRYLESEAKAFLEGFKSAFQE